MRDDASMGNTPWGTGAQTPASPGRSFLDDKRPPVIGAFERPSLRKEPSHRSPKSGTVIVAWLLRSILLFWFGVAYGVVITHLQDNEHLIPVKVGGIDRESWRYLIFWGVAGVVFGTLLPWIDVFWEESEAARPADPKTPVTPKQNQGQSDVPEGSEEGVSGWNPAIRSIGAFMGIAFAIVSATLTFRD